MAAEIGGKKTRFWTDETRKHFLKINKVQFLLEKNPPVLRELETRPATDLPQS
jgi:hypothetical protein